jgi:hypothetical protein
MQPDGPHPSAFEVCPVGRISLDAYGEFMPECDRKRIELSGRDTAFSRITNVAYVPRDVSRAIIATGAPLLRAAAEVIAS